MNDHQPEIDPAIAHLDIPFCDWGESCPSLAVWRITFHFVNNCTIPVDPEHQARRDEDGNHVIPMCASHFEELRVQAEAHVWKLRKHRVPACQSCGAPMRAVTDIIREREKL